MPEILEIDFNNPAIDESSPDWTKKVCGGKTLPDARWEWTPILDSNNEFDDEMVGVSGTAINLEDSQADLWFTHPFGNDFVFDIKPDPQYLTLNGPNNGGLLHVEIDKGLVPQDFHDFAKEGDRVAVFGRWIVDCGHDDFGTEIHPPLLMAFAQVIPAQSSNLSDITSIKITSRPYLVSQEFGDGGFWDHVKNEIVKVVGIPTPIPCVFIPQKTRIEIRPKIMSKPFSGIHLIKLFTKLPSPRPDWSDGLFVSFHFTVRTGVVVQLFDAGSDSVGIIIELNDANYKPPNLPPKRDFNVTLDMINHFDPDVAKKINELIAGAILGCDISAAAIIKQGALTDLYDAPTAPSVSDSEFTNVRLSELSANSQFSVNDEQPFPILGTINLSWARKAIPMPTDAAPAVVGVGSNIYIFAKGLDGRVFYNRAVLGQGGIGWVEVDGGGRIGSAPAAGAVENHIFVAAKGLNESLFLNQADLGGPFGNWSGMDFSTDVAPAVVGVGNNVYFFAKGSDGRVFYNRAVLGQGGIGWVEVDGGGRIGSAPAAGAVENHIFLAAKGLDQNIYLNQADLGGPFGNWSRMDFPTATDVAPAVVGVGDSVYFFAKDLEGRVFYNLAKLGQGGQGWKEVEGNGRIGSAPSAGAVGNHVFVAAKGLDQNIYLNQADLGGSFSGWNRM